MAMFSYLYYFAFIRETEIDVASILETVLKLDQRSQLEIFGKLGNYLIGEHMIPGDPLDRSILCHAFMSRVI